MNYMKHFLVLFFDKPAREFLNFAAKRLYADYCPGVPLPEIEHHLTLQYFQCEEQHYPELIEETTKILPDFLPLKIKLFGIHEYVNEMNDFCCLSLLAEKNGPLLKLHQQLTGQIDRFHLHHEPSDDWPPHITCFPGQTLAQRPKAWNKDAGHHIAVSAPQLSAVELRLTRWNGTEIETVHNFNRIFNQAP